MGLRHVRGRDVRTKYIGHLADSELVSLAQKGDNAAFGVLIERYRRFATAKCRGYFIVGGDTDDLEQEALIGLYKAVRDYRSERGGSLRTFIELCVSRQIVTAIKRATRQKHQPLNRSVPIPRLQRRDSGSETTLEELLVERAPEPAEMVVSVEAMVEMEATLSESLSELESTAFRLHCGGKSAAEIGETLGKDAKAIDNAIQRTRRKLQRQINAG